MSMTVAAGPAVAAGRVLVSWSGGMRMRGTPTTMLMMSPAMLAVAVAVVPPQPRAACLLAVLMTSL